MRDLTSWGLYITMFMFFVGLSAGGLIIATVPRVFQLRGFKPISKVAVFLSICCTILAAAFIVVDLGRPGRIWHLIAYSNLDSPLMWDVLVITTYLMISIVYLGIVLRVEKGKGSERALNALSTTAFVTAVLVHSVTAWIFGLQMARPFWHSSLLAPMFISSALVSGLALTLFVVLILKNVGYLQKDSDTLGRMAKLLGIFVLVDLFLLFCELLTAFYPLGGTEYAAFRMMLGGVFAPMFWTEVLGGLFAAYLLLKESTRMRTGLVGFASLLAIIGVFFKRYQLLLARFGLPNLTYAGVTTGPQASDAGSLWHLLGSAFFYFPSLAEWGITIGILSLGATMMTLGLKYLELKPLE
jgi:molybdopterin-containing oxidoreductase family membrane subunit